MKSILKLLGPSGIIAGALFLLLVISCFFQKRGKRVADCTYDIQSYVSSIKEVGKLKPLAVLESGLMTYPNDPEKQKKAMVDCMYRGVSEFYVDVSKGRFNCTNISQRLLIDVTLPEPECGDVMTWPNGKNDEGELLLNYEQFGGNDDHEIARIRLSLPRIQAAYIRKLINTAERRKMAKQQTERIIRFMISPIVEDRNRDIVIRWEDDK